MDGKNAAFSDRNDPAIVPTPILGEESGDAEWSSTAKSVELFIHTNSYAALKEPHVLFLFGRRGTGKTSLLRMLQHEIREGLVREFGSAWSMDQNDAYAQLGQSVRNSALAAAPDTELVEFLKNQWIWMCEVSAMHAVLWQCKMRSFDLSQVSGDLRVIEKYLLENELLADGGALELEVSPVQRLIDVLLEAVDEVEVKGTMDYAKIIRVVYKRLRTRSHARARQALRRISGRVGGHALVIVDSLDDYNLDDKVSRCVVAAAVEAALAIYTRRHNDRLVANGITPKKWTPSSYRDRGLLLVLMGRLEGGGADVAERRVAPA